MEFAIARSVASAELTLQTRLCLLPEMMGSDSRLSMDECLVLTHIGQQTTTRQVAMKTGLPQRRVLTIVASLLDGGLIMGIPQADLSC